MFELLLIGFTSIFKIIFTLILIPFRCLGYKLRCYTTDNYVTVMLPKLSDNALIITNEYNPQDFSFGKWYIAYIYTEKKERSNDTIIYLFSTEKKAKELITRSDTIKRKTESDIISITRLCKTRGGSWWGYDYGEIISDCNRLVPTYEQSDICDNILNQYNITQNCVVFIDGEPGAKKSSISRILCSRLKDSVLCDEFDPLLAGDSYSGLINKFNSINAEKKRTLILVLDEVDIIIKYIDKKGPESQKLFTQTPDKTSWNKWLDTVTNYGNNIILLMTSNTPYDEISKDTSYLRNGRVHLKFTLNKTNDV
jgi:hypothetical protein